MIPTSILCMDLMEEILSWLPVKSLIRFRCVCKSFKSLTCNPTFTKLHLKRSPKTTTPLFRISGRRLARSVALSCSVLENPSSSAVESISEPPHSHSSSIVGSCNGLICYVTHQHNHCNNLLYRISVFYLWNPVTRVRSIDSPSLLLLHDQGHFTRYEFGYDNLSDTYKAVTITFSLDETSPAAEVRVCSIGREEEDCRWRTIQQHLPVFSMNVCNQPHGVYLKNSLHWLTSHSDQYMVASLDLNKETYTRFSLPPRNDHRDLDPLNLHLSVSNDSFSFSYSHEGCFVVWKMKEYGNGNSWTQLLRIQTEDWFPIHESLILRFTANGGGIMIMPIRGKHAILYNQFRRDGKVEYVQISPGLAYIHDIDYIPSLVSPCSS